MNTATGSLIFCVNTQSATVTYFCVLFRNRHYSTLNRSRLFQDFKNPILLLKTSVENWDLCYKIYSFYLKHGYRYGFSAVRVQTCKHVDKHNFSSLCCHLGVPNYVFLRFVKPGRLRVQVSRRSSWQDGWKSCELKCRSATP